MNIKRRIRKCKWERERRNGGKWGKTKKILQLIILLIFLLIINIFLLCEDEMNIRKSIRNYKRERRRERKREEMEEDEGRQRRYYN